jgi:hypothetical protein
MDMDYRRTLRMLQIRIGPKQHAACTYLEQVGLRFCVDYGYDNAISLAREHWRNRRLRRKRR